MKNKSKEIFLSENDAIILLSWAARGLAVAKRLKFSKDMIRKAENCIVRIKQQIEKQIGRGLLLIKWSD